MSLNISDEGYNNGKKYGQKGTICGPNSHHNIIKYHSIIHRVQIIKATEKDSKEEDLEEA